MNNLLSSFKTVAGVLKLVDKPDLGSGAERRMGSIPFARTKKAQPYGWAFFVRAKGIFDFSTPVTS